MAEGIDFTHEVSRSTEGALREALATLGTFEQLLRSRKVAPKAILGVLQDMRLCCEPLLSNLDQVPRPSAFPDNEQIKHCTMLGEFLRKHVEDLELALTVPTRRTLSARHRLQLETTVVRVRRQMSGTLPLLQLCREVQRDPLPQIDVGELLQLCRSGDQPTTPHSRRAQVRLQVSPDSFRLTASPRAVLTLIGLVGSLVGQRLTDKDNLCVRLSPVEQSRCLSVSVGGRDGPQLPLVLPPVVEPTDDTLRYSAQLLGLAIVDEPGAMHLTWTPGERGASTRARGL